MWYRTITIASLAVLCNCDHDATKNNNSDVIVTYAGHAEAVEPKYQPKPNVITTTTTAEPIRILIPESYATETTIFSEDETESVVFVPNEKPVVRFGDYHEDKISITDVMQKRVVDKGVTEPPNEDILFISGKNRDQSEKSSKKETDYSSKTSVKEKKKVSLDCSNLDCNNTMNSVCGGKLEHKQWRYRLFLNECYFRKVNCGFKYETNRFRVVAHDHCKNIGSRNSMKPFVYYPPPPTVETTTLVPKRRNWSSRRSLSLQVDGTFCSHACPSSCPEDYSPECAITARGRRKVFVNHCKLDYDSCSYGTVWHRRPLAECVGNQKAEIRQNRAFIGWMQQIGVIDDKGRLVTE